MPLFTQQSILHFAKCRLLFVALVLGGAAKVGLIVTWLRGPSHAVSRMSLRNVRSDGLTKEDISYGWPFVLQARPGE